MIIICIPNSEAKSLERLPKMPSWIMQVTLGISGVWASRIFLKRG